MREPSSSSQLISPLSKTIVLAKMRDLGDGTKRRVGNDRGRDVTNEAAQLVWHL
ncbi:DUF7446 family protein, partial [Escherichia coli]|uniref:DUF7446 family protein n=1 Tax=Escherichia coli TaxID=562 RepID=UPI003EE41D03